MKTNPTPFPPVHPLPVIQTAPPDETPPAAAPLPPPVQAAEEHFRRYLFSVIARLVAQLDANRESFAAVLAGLPFVDAYQTHLLSQAPPDVPLLALPAWWDEQVAAFERGYSGHLPLRALVAEAGLTPGAVRLLLAAGLVEEDVRFGSLFALLQEPLAARRPCVGLLTWLLGAPADAADQVRQGRHLALQPVGQNQIVQQRERLAVLPAYTRRGLARRLAANGVPDVGGHAQQPLWADVAGVLDRQQPGLGQRPRRV